MREREVTSWAFDHHPGAGPLLSGENCDHGIRQAAAFPSRVKMAIGKSRPQRTREQGSLPQGYRGLVGANPVRESFGAVHT